mgnify:CR=1 FL=1
MITNIQNNRNNVQFTALKVTPAFDKWNEDVLSAVLQSKTIKNIIAKDAQNGQDTFMTFNKSFTPTTHGGNYEMGVHIKSPQDEIKLNSFTNERYDSALGRKIVTGAKNLGEDIVNQIRALDKENLSISKMIEDLKGIAGGIEIVPAKEPEAAKAALKAEADAPKEEKRSFWDKLFGIVDWD